jgi:hypothetical protein
MTIDFSKDGEVKVLMQDYIEGMLGASPEEMGGEAATPTANHLFTVNEDPELRDEKTSEMYHYNTGTLLFLSKHARLDIQVSVAFITTRVKVPDKDDYKKLGRVMMYLRGTINMPLKLEADNLSWAKWWVNRSFTVHHDMKSHTGSTMILGK